MTELAKYIVSVLNDLEAEVVDYETHPAKWNPHTVGHLHGMLSMIDRVRIFAPGGDRIDLPITLALNDRRNRLVDRMIAVKRAD